MDINILGFKISLELLILIGIIYLILATHTVCGCCNMPLIMEGLSNMTSSDSSNSSNNSKKNISNLMSGSGSNSSSISLPTKEGFAGANTNYGESSQYTLGDYSKVDTSSWGMPTLTVTPGGKQSKGVQDILNRPEQPLPLPEGEMLMFANTPFKPECCPNTYSNSSGCACMTTGQYNGLVTRFGNNVPYSEY
jgi:hypothetical protein